MMRYRSASVFAGWPATPNAWALCLTTMTWFVENHRPLDEVPPRYFCGFT